MDSQNTKSAARRFASAFATAASASLSTAIGSAWPLEVMQGSDSPTRKAQSVQFRMKVDGDLRGECFVEFYEPPVSDLVAKMGNAGEQTAADKAKTLANVLATATSSLATALAPEFGELTFRVDCVSGLAFGGMFVVPLAASADPAQAPVLLYFDNQLIAAMAARNAGTQASTAPERGFNPGNLKLVMDVELNVSLRFGQRQLPLREVLELSSGSVIELDRLVDEPVELLLDGKVVACGEAVIVDGNYGLRVTEIPQAIDTHFLR
jgi:flagellar motor switch protein FliN/FliY